MPVDNLWGATNAGSRHGTGEVSCVGPPFVQASAGVEASTGTDTGLSASKAVGAGLGAGICEGRHGHETALVHGYSAV